jgi:hypothetical protein
MAQIAELKKALVRVDRFPPFGFRQCQLAAVRAIRRKLRTLKALSPDE